MIIANRKLDPLSMGFLLAVLTAIILLYLPFLKSLVHAWEIDDNYSHGYFIPFVSLAMIWSQRHKLATARISPVNSSLLLLLAGLAMLVVAKVGSELFLQRFSMIPVLLGVTGFLLGREYLRYVRVPILYLVFMIPLPAIIWNKIAFPMQLFGSYLTEQLIYGMGIPVFREGNILHLAETTLEVVAACSGLRSLVTMFALAGAFSFFSTLSLPRKWLLFVSAAPIAILANIFRLTLTALLASKYGSEVANGFLHEFSGILIFVLGLFMLIAVNSFLSR